MHHMVGIETKQDRFFQVFSGDTKLQDVQTCQLARLVVIFVTVLVNLNKEIERFCHQVEVWICPFADFLLLTRQLGGRSAVNRSGASWPAQGYMAPFDPRKEDAQDAFYLRLDPVILVPELGLEACFANAGSCASCEAHLAYEAPAHCLLDCSAR